MQTYVHMLVKERESGAQLLMRQQGLRPAPAALAAYCWFAVLYGVFMLAFVGFGAAIGLNVFTKTGPGVQARTVRQGRVGCSSAEINNQS
jgi:hypothetical protein